MPCSDSQMLLRCLQLHMSACLAGASVRYVMPSWPWHLHYPFKQPDNVAPLHCAILRLLHALQLPEQLFAQLLQLLVALTGGTVELNESCERAGRPSMAQESALDRVARAKQMLDSQTAIFSETDLAELLTKDARRKQQAAEGWTSS